MTIATIAANAAKTLRGARTCTSADIEQAIRLHLRACRRARQTHPDAVLRTTLDAFADRVTITGGYARDLTVEAKRGGAQSRRYGRDSVVVIRRVSPDQTKGTIVESQYLYHRNQTRLSRRMGIDQ